MSNAMKYVLPVLLVFSVGIFAFSNDVYASYGDVYTSNTITLGSVYDSSTEEYYNNSFRVQVPYSVEPMEMVSLDDLSVSVGAGVFDLGTSLSTLYNVYQVPVTQNMFVSNEINPTYISGVFMYRITCNTQLLASNFNVFSTVGESFENVSCSVNSSANGTGQFYVNVTLNFDNFCFTRFASLPMINMFLCYELNSGSIAYECRPTISSSLNLLTMHDAPVHYGELDVIRKAIDTSETLDDMLNMLTLLRNAQLTANGNITSITALVSTIKDNIGTENIGTVKSLLNLILTDTSDIKNAVNNINSNTSSINTNVGNINNNVGSISSDTSSINTNVADIESLIRSMYSLMDTIDDRLSDISPGVLDKLDDIIDAINDLKMDTNGIDYQYYQNYNTSIRTQVTDIHDIEQDIYLDLNGYFESVNLEPNIESYINTSNGGIGNFQEDATLVQATMEWIPQFIQTIYGYLPGSMKFLIQLVLVGGLVITFIGLVNKVNPTSRPSEPALNEYSILAIEDKHGNRIAQKYDTPLLP